MDQSSGSESYLAAESALAAGAYRDAVDLFVDAMNEESNPQRFSELRLDAAYSARLAGDPDHAIELVSPLVERIDLIGAKARLIRGNAYLEGHRADLAATDLQDAVQLAVGSGASGVAAHAIAGYALALSALSRPTDALDLLASTTRTAGLDATSMRALRTARAQVLEDLGRLDDSLAELEALISQEIEPHAQLANLALAARVARSAGRSAYADDLLGEANSLAARVQSTLADRLLASGD